MGWVVGIWLLLIGTKIWGLWMSWCHINNWLPNTFLMMHCLPFTRAFSFKPNLICHNSLRHTK